MYYIFWGICTFAVVSGQVYVGSGYRLMSQSVNMLTYALTGELLEGGSDASQSIIY